VKKVIEKYSKKAKLAKEIKKERAKIREMMLLHRGTLS